MLLGFFLQKMDTSVEAHFKLKPKVPITFIALFPIPPHPLSLQCLLPLSFSILFSPSHLAPSFFSPPLQSLHIIYFVHLDLESFCGCRCAAGVRGSRRPQRAIYPACTWAGGGRRRGGDGPLGGTVRRRGRGRVQGQGGNEATALET